MNITELHWLWGHLKRAQTITFGSSINTFYNSDLIEGYISAGWPIGLWTLREQKGGKIIEETIFIR